MINQQLRQYTLGSFGYGVRNKHNGFGGALILDLLKMLAKNHTNIPFLPNGGEKW